VIYLNEESENRQEFENLLQRSKDLTLSGLSNVENPSSISGPAFEQMVYDASLEAAVGTRFEGKVIKTEDRDFPDIVAAGFFGVEVKVTKKDDWSSIGNSVLESSRIPSVEKIYVFFGKLGGEPDIIYRDYESCLKGIAVTHYPRYQIDMKLAEGESIFSKMGVGYDAIRNSANPVKDIRKYYKERLEKGQSLWWIDDNLDETATSAPVIKNLASLSVEEKDNIRADVFLYFPEVFSNSSKKFERIPAYLIASHSVLSSHLRDLFTAGGQVSMRFNGENIKVPQIIGEACRLSSKVAANLSGKEESELSEAWQKHIENFSEPWKAWLEEVDRQSADLNLPVKFSELLRSALDTAQS
jgi:hypothetical protein